MHTASGGVVTVLEPNSALQEIVHKLSFPRIKEFKVWPLIIFIYIKAALRVKKEGWFLEVIKNQIRE